MEDICGQVHLSLFVFIKCIAECEFVILIKITTLCHSFRGSGWSFQVNAKMCRFVQLEIQLTEGIGIPITGLTPPNCCACPLSGHGCSTPYVVVFTYVQ